MNRNYRLQATLSALLALLLVASLGCNREPQNIATSDYFVAGALVQVIDHDPNISFLELSDSILPHEMPLI